MLIGSRLKKLRIQNGMSQQQLGDMIGVTKVSICGYENGTRTPCLETFWLLADIFNVSGDYLAGREVPIINENDQMQIGHMSEEEIDTIKTLRQYPDIHQMLMENPKRMIPLINKKIIKQ